MIIAIVHGIRRYCIETSEVNVMKLSNGWLFSLQILGMSFDIYEFLLMHCNLLSPDSTWRDLQIRLSWIFALLLKYLTLKKINAIVVVVAMGGSAHLSYTMAALMASGGAFAFFKKGSKPSLIAGCGVGALFLGSGKSELLKKLIVSCCSALKQTSFQF